MATRELSLFADLDQGRLVQSFLSTLQAPQPRFVFGDSIPVSFRPLKSNGNNSVNPWSEVDLTGKTVRIAIGNPGGAPSNGTFTLSYGGDTSAAIAYNAGDAAIQTALNALASITAAGGVVVTRATTGAFRIVFNTAGARTAITADAAAIYPSAGVEIYVAVEGDGSTREIAVARIETLPAAYAELTDDFPVAASEIVEVRAGVVGNAAAPAECVLALVTGSVDSDSWSIGEVVFVMKDFPTGENQIQIGVDDVETLANIKAKILAHSTVLVTALDRDATSLRIRAKTSGAAGNSIGVDNISSAISFGDESLDSVDNLYGGLDYVASLSGVQSLEFTVLPYSGFYMLEIGGEQTLGIPWDADASTLQAALELLPGIGAGKVVVSGEFPAFTLNFDLTLGDIGAMTIDMTGLVVPKGRAGLLSTNTAAMIELLNGASQATAKLEVKLYDIGDGTTWTLQTDCTVIDDVIGNSPATAPAFPSTMDLVGALIRTSAQGPPDMPQVEAAYIGQWCRVMTANPDDGIYDWYQWNGTTWFFVRRDGLEPVNVTGNQSIAGEKRFSDAIYYDGPSGGPDPKEILPRGYADTLYIKKDFSNADAKSIALSKISQSGATNSQVPTWDGTAWVPATPSTGTTDAGALTGTLAPARIANESLPIAKTTGLTAALDGKLALSLASAVNVKSYGAVGDNAADDTAAIQSAMDTNRPVYLPPGNYRITSALKFKTIGQRLIGAGPNLTTIRVAATNHNAIQFQQVGGADVRDCLISDLTILGPGYATSGAGQTGVYWMDPATELTLISAYNVLNRVHIGGFDRGVFAHQNPGLTISNSMVCGCNTAVDLAHVDHWLFTNSNFHSWGTMGERFFNHPGGLLLRIRSALAGASNPGPGLSGMFIEGELTRCARAVWMSSGNMTMIGGNMESACSGSIDAGATQQPIGDESFYLEGSCLLVLDNVRMASLTSGTGVPNGTTTLWSKRAKIRCDITVPGSTPRVVLRGGWKHEVIGWDDVAMFGTGYHIGGISNLTGYKVYLSRYPSVNGALVSTVPILQDWNRTKEFTDVYLNTPTGLVGQEGEMNFVTQSTTGKDFRLMAVMKRADGNNRRIDLLNDALIEVLHCSETPRGNTGATQTERLLLNPIPQYIIKQDNGSAGERLVIEAGGYIAANANSKTVTLRRNGADIITFPATTASGKYWTLRATIQNIGAGSNSRVYATLTVDNAVQVLGAMISPINWALNTNTIGIGLTGAATDDIQMYSSRVVYECSAKKY